MMETDWAKRVYGHTGVAEMHGAKGVYTKKALGLMDYIMDCVLYLISSHLIIQRITHSIIPIF
jgi:hypothetical protein